MKEVAILERYYLRFLQSFLECFTLLSSYGATYFDEVRVTRGFLFKVGEKIRIGHEMTDFVVVCAVNRESPISRCCKPTKNTLLSAIFWWVDLSTNLFSRGVDFPAKLLAPGGGSRASSVRSPEKLLEILR